MSAKSLPPVDLNMTRMFMNTTMEWFANMGYAQMHFICDANMFDVGILADQVNGLGQIVLNLSANATRGFQYNEHDFDFHCGKNGVDVHLHVPYEAVLGFNVHFGENNQVSLPIPNFERHMVEVAAIKAYHEAVLASQSQDKPDLPDGAYAVHGVDTDFEHSEVPNPHSAPTIAELMHRKPMDQRPKEPVVKEKPKPLLDFGALPGEQAIIAAPPRPRRVGAPHLTLIQGGKA